jgi:hypothetical protein
MTTGESETQTATPLQPTQQGVPDSTPASEQAPVEAPSLEDQIATLTAANEKLEGQRSSQDQRLSKLQSEATSTQQLGERLENMSRDHRAAQAETRAGFKEIASGNTENIDGAMEAAGSSVRANWEAELRESDYEGLVAEMNDYMENAQAVADWKTELARYNSRNGTKTIEGFRKILTDAKGTKITADLAAKDALLAEKDAELKNARGQFEKEYEVNDVNTGPAGGSVGGSFKKIRDAFNEDPYDPKVQKAYYEARKRRGL